MVGARPPLPHLPPLILMLPFLPKVTISSAALLDISLLHKTQSILVVIVAAINSIALETLFNTAI